MKKVGIPYDIREGKLFMVPVQWPQKCVCCGVAEDNTNYEIVYKAHHTSTTVGSTTKSNFYPLTWKLPYCDRCKTHATQTSNLFMVIVVLCILMPIVSVIALGKTSSTVAFLIALAASIILGIIAYQVLLRTVVFSKMTDSCTHHADALFGSDDSEQIYFHFYNDEIAEGFAQMNRAELMDTVKPNFWTGKKA